MNFFKYKLKNTKNLFSINLKRASLFYFLKLIRVKDTQDKLAKGFACGSMVSFTPFIGFHFFLAVFLFMLYAIFQRARSNTYLIIKTNFAKC